MNALKNNEHRSICARCGGQCCRTRPGIESPERFQAQPDPATALAELLIRREWILETHYGVPYTPGVTAPDPDRIIQYPRPATMSEQSKNSAGITAADDCVYLTPVGCSLAFDSRPRMCRELIPDSCFECETPWGRREAALAWLHHQDIIQAASATLAVQKGSQP
ncbi:MAG: hypothetical protein OEL57_02710 [Trichlorobacter sp.]|uniref:hypothetical protein n=1 Tax=Trichlorobacter sp. TaxID=2911007 RepID=UPI00255FF230|nr:hypothetical protein [Trichlorobacter sp.]MDK9716803.1 hypothetical protein [Trichlorobacter sp.]